MKNEFYITKLQQQFEFICSNNPSYSLRAFARDLDIDCGNLKKILTNEISVSPKVAYRIARHLKLDERESFQFILPSLE